MLKCRLIGYHSQPWQIPIYPYTAFTGIHQSLPQPNTTILMDTTSSKNIWCVTLRGRLRSAKVNLGVSRGQRWFVCWLFGNNMAVVERWCLICWGFFQEKTKLFKKYLVQDFIFGNMDVKCLNDNNLLVFFKGGSWTNYLHYVTVPCKCQSLHAQTENQIYLLIK